MHSAFNPRALRDRLSRFPAVVTAAASVCHPDDLRWKPAPEHWSILEILCHLLDEEREDFRVRADLTLRDPQQEWPPLDLKDVANKRDYTSKNPQQVLAEFERERAASIAWVDGLANTADWGRSKLHVQFGPLAAGMLLASWAAHDALHLRQIAKRLHDLAARDAGEYSVVYAGDW
jgi:hypothetical protein